MGKYERHLGKKRHCRKKENNVSQELETGIDMTYPGKCGTRFYQASVFPKDA